MVFLTASPSHECPRFYIVTVHALRSANLMFVWGALTKTLPLALEESRQRRTGSWRLQLFGLGTCAFEKIDRDAMKARAKRQNQISSRKDTLLG